MSSLFPRPMLEPADFALFRHDNDPHVQQWYGERTIPLVTRAKADARQDFNGVVGRVQLMETAYDRCMKFFHEYYDPKTNTHTMYWSMGWFDHRMVYLFLTTYAQQYGELIIQGTLTERFPEEDI